MSCVPAVVIDWRSRAAPRGIKWCTARCIPKRDQVVYGSTHSKTGMSPLPATHAERGRSTRAVPSPAVAPQPILLQSTSLPHTRESLAMPLAFDVPTCNGDFDGTTELVDPANQPFDAASIDDAALELRHPGLRNAVARRDGVLRARTQGAHDLARQLAPQLEYPITGL